MYELIDQLKEKGIRVAMLSNIDDFCFVANIKDNIRKRARSIIYANHFQLMAQKPRNRRSNPS